MGSDRGRATRLEPSLARQFLLTQVAVVLVLVVVSVLLAVLDARRDARDGAREESLSVARAVADSPDVVSGVLEDDATRSLQPYVERVRAQTGIDFITVMDLDRVRLTHPNPDRIGERFVGDVGGAPRGRPFVQEYAGTLGPSVRSVVPVERSGQVVALVAVGITVARIDDALRDDLALIGLAAAAVLGVGLAGSWLVHRRLRRQTHGMGEREITRMYEYYRAVLHAVREGLLLLDDEGTVQLVNDEARRLLDLPDDVVGSDVRRLGLPPGLVAAALGPQAETDDIYLTNQHVLLVSTAPASWEGRDVGVVVTLRDHTELQAVSGERDLANDLTQALRAQNHESANRLHTVVSLVEMGRTDEAVDFATEELQVAQVLTDQVVGQVGDPVLAALLLAKSAQASERGASLRVEGAVPQGGWAARDLVTVLGNLLDNALDAVTGADTALVRVRLAAHGDRLQLHVADSGPGMEAEEAASALQRGWSTKAGEGTGARGVGLALVQQVARRHGGEVDITRGDLGGAEIGVVLVRGRS